MKRKDQLRNVAFGGAWSETIAGLEELRDALSMLRRSARGSWEDDPREDPDVTGALDLAVKDHPKGEMLRKAWYRAAALPEPGRRVVELLRISSLLEEGQRSRIGNL